MGILGAGYPVMHEAIVNLKSGVGFRGVIWDRRGGYLVLRNAERLAAGGQATPVDGEVLIAERDVEFIQLPRAGD